MKYRKFPYKNKAENQFWSGADLTGKRVSKRGWPDFIVFEGKKIIGVCEVKRLEMTPLKEEQRIVMEYLQKHGVPCFRYSGDTGKVEKFDPTTEASRVRESRKRRTLNKSVLGAGNSSQSGKNY